MNVIEKHYSHCLVSPENVAQRHTDIISLYRCYDGWGTFIVDTKAGEYSDSDGMCSLRGFFDLSYQKPIKILNDPEVERALEQHGIYEHFFHDLEYMVEDIILLDQIRIGLKMFYTWDYDGVKLPGPILSFFNAREYQVAREYNNTREFLLNFAMEEYIKYHPTVYPEQFAMMMINFKPFIDRTTRVLHYYGHSDVVDFYDPMMHI